MKKLLFSVSLALALFSAPAYAQQPSQALVVSSCGSQSLTAATYGYLTMDSTGKLCNGNGGSGGTVTANQGTPGASAWPVSLPNDVSPTVQTISAADAASATITGQNGVSYYTGTPTASSAAAQTITNVSSDTIGISGNFVGTLQFESQDTNGDWFVSGAWQRGSGSTTGPVNSVMVCASPTYCNGVFDLNTSGKTGVRMRATAFTSGSASVNHTFSNAYGLVRNESPSRIIDNNGNAATIKAASTAPVATDTAIVVSLSPNTASKGGVAVVNGGSFYQAVAASQTGTTLQSSAGAAGDYLSHCVIYPASTSPGVVTVFDSTNTAANSVILFAGGASSLSNLAPIPVPVGANSVNGAWKVTTGANVSVVCYGKFS